MTAAGSKVLVTGADGFIGSELCRQLVAAGHTLVRFTSVRRQSPTADADGNALATRDFSGDVRDRELLHRAMNGVQTVFHLAGIAHVDGPQQALLQAVNVAGTANVAEAARTAGVCRFIYFSSSLAAAAEHNSPAQTAYGRSKYQAEQQLLTIVRDSSLQVIVLRPVNVYGPGMKGNVAAMIRLIERGVLPPLPKLRTRLSLVGLQDLCRAALLVAATDRTASPIYTVTDGVDYRLVEIESAIYRALGKQPPSWHSPRGIYFLAAAAAGLLNRIGLLETGFGLRTYRNLVADNLYSNRAICDELGFEPEQTFYTALPELVQVK